MEGSTNYNSNSNLIHQSNKKKLIDVIAPYIGCFLLYGSTVVAAMLACFVFREKPNITPDELKKHVKDTIVFTGVFGTIQKISSARSNASGVEYKFSKKLEAEKARDKDPANILLR